MTHHSRTILTSHARSAARCIACVMMVFVLSAPAHAEDRIVVQPPTSRGRMAVNGTIVSLDRRELTIRTPAGQIVKRFPIDEVVSIEAEYTEAHLRGLEQLATGKLLEAEVTLSTAYDKEPRSWVQDQILAALIDIALRRDDRVGAGTRFERLVTHSPDTREFGRIPLLWTSTSVTGPLRDAGKVWLTSSAAPMQLLGASLLLNDRTGAQVAEQTLQRLARDADSRIAQLARAQLWRLRLKAHDITERERSSWRQQIEAMPASLRAGPTYLLGEASRQLNDHESATADLLRLPLALDAPYDLSARAGLHAAESLVSLGRKDDALTVLDDLRRRYADAQAAPVIQTRYDELTKAGP